METPKVQDALKAMPIKTDRQDVEGIARPIANGLVSASPRQIDPGAEKVGNAVLAHGCPAGHC
jgi:hypothetical protein